MQLLDKYGRETVEAANEELMNYSERMLRQEIEALPDEYRSIVAAMRAKPRAEWFGFLGTPAEAIAYFRERRDAGLRYFMARVLEDDTDTLRLLASRVMPEVTRTAGV